MSVSIFLFYRSKNNKFILLSILNLPIFCVLFLRHNFAFMEIDRFYYFWIIIFYFYVILEFAKFQYPKYLILFFLTLVYLNNFLFLSKFNNYEVDTNQSINLFLPIKSILKKEKNSNKLEIYTNMEINKFDVDLYPNLKKVTLYKSNINDFNCVCEKDKINIYIVNKLNYNNSFCKFNYINDCKKIFDYSNNDYQVEVFK